MNASTLALTKASPLLLVIACSSNPVVSDDAGGAGGAAGAASTQVGGTSGAPPLRCPAGSNPRSDPQRRAVGVVSGQFMDEEGQPTSAGLVQICGKDLCINARVGEDGKLAESVGQTLDAPACKFGDGLAWGKQALPLGAGDSKLAALTAVRLPDFADSAPFTPGSNVSSGGVTLELDPNVRVEVDTLTYEEEAQRGFRAAALVGPSLTQLQQEFELGFTFSPVETRLCPSPALRVENLTGLAAGTELELFMLGVDVLETWAPYAGWKKVGDGAVTEDGKSLEFPEGLPLLTTIGIKVKR